MIVYTNSFLIPVVVSNVQSAFSWLPPHMVVDVPLEVIIA
jgi:hypothetical protein